MKVIIVDDSALIRSILKQVLSEAEDIEVIAEASNGKAGLEAVKNYDPDMVILDINMPIMDGIEATGRIMTEHPCPIMIFSTLVDAETSFKAIQAGAVDVLAKPDISQFNEKSFRDTFFQKIRAVGQIKGRRAEKSESGKVEKRDSEGIKMPAMLVLGASTGGPKAVRAILEKLPADLPVPAVLVQHLETGFDAGFCEWLSEKSNLRVQLVKEEVRPEKGIVYVAATDRHLIFKDGKITLFDGEKILNQKPSVDVLFKSAAGVFGSAVLGVLLTGMGRDGALGCLEIIRSGGITLVQDEFTSAIYGMPREAVNLGAATEILALEDIPGRILGVLNYK